MRISDSCRTSRHFREGPKGDKRLTLHDKSKFPLKKAARFGGLVADHAREPASAGER
jgi:hypothetical protein